MRLFLLITIITLFISASAEANNLRVVVFGDSLTSGYQLQPQEAFPVKLKNKLKEIGFKNVDVVDMSTSDDSTVKALDRVDDLLLKRPDVVILAYGLSDVMRSIDPAVIYQNIATIAAQLKQKRIYTVLMGIEAPGLGKAYGQQLPNYFHNIASQYGVSFHPNALEGIAGESRYTTADGYSPNAQGVDIMVEGMYRLVDAGLRWKISVLQQEQYNRSLQ